MIITLNKIKTKVKIIQRVSSILLVMMRMIMMIATTTMKIMMMKVSKMHINPRTRNGRIGFMGSRNSSQTIAHNQIPSPKTLTTITTIVKTMIKVMITMMIIV